MTGWRKRQVMIPAKEIGGELWISAADHHQAIKEALAQPQQEPVDLRAAMLAAAPQPAQQEPWNEDEWRKNNWRCGHGWLRGEQCEICNAAQEPVACLDCGSHNVGRSATYDSLINSVKTQPEQEPVVCKHEWFRTGAMEPRECRCIKCGAWNTTSLQRT